MAQRILVTGAAGAIGRIVAPALTAAGHDVRGFDRNAGPYVTHQGELQNATAVDAVIEGCETVVHLGACPDVADFVEALVPANVVGLYRVLDACRRYGVKKVIMASTARVAGGKSSERAANCEGYDIVSTSSVRPRDHYALTKLWAEEMGEMYARCHGIAVLAARICWFPRNPRECQRLIRSNARGAYLSHNDAGRFFVSAVAAECHGFHVVYAVSRPPEGRHVFDPRPAASVIGYEPQDVFPEGLTFDFQE